MKMTRFSCVANPTILAGSKQGEQGHPTTLEKRLDKVLAQEPEQPDSLTKVYLAKRGEGEPKGWYASSDGKTDRERKEPVEKTLERTCVSSGFRFAPVLSCPSTLSRMSAHPFLKKRCELIVHAISPLCYTATSLKKTQLSRQRVEKA